MDTTFSKKISKLQKLSGKKFVTVMLKRDVNKLCQLSAEYLLNSAPWARSWNRLFLAWPKIRYSIYDHCGWRSCILNLWRTFVDGLVDDIEKVAVQNVWKWYLIYNQNGLKTIPFGVAHIYIAHVREYSLPFAVNWGGFPVRHQKIYWLDSIYHQGSLLVQRRSWEPGN